MDEQPDLKSYRDYLHTLTPLTDEDWNSLNELLYLKEFNKKDLFLTSNSKCKTIGFILQGCFRSVKNCDGEERTFDFAIEQEFVTNYYSVLTGKPSQVEIIAVEPSIVACVDANKFFKLFDSSFPWQKIGRHLAEYAACYYSERLVAAYYESPRMRYDKLMQNAPELFLRIPHHILANYLGMTKETLSRLRNPSR